MQDPNPEVKKLLDEAKVARDARKWDEALKLSQAALEKSTQLKDKLGEGQSRFAIARTYNYSNRFREALAEYDIARPILLEAGDKLHHALSTSESGVMHYRLGDLKMAKSRFEEALPLYVALGDKNSEAGMLMNLGIITENTGDPAAALKIYEKVLPIFRELKRREGEANTLANIGIANGKLGNYETELKYLQESLAIEIEIKRLPQQILGYRNVGVCYERMYRYQDAMDAHMKAKEIAKQLNDPYREATADSMIASMYYSLGKFQKAREIYERVVPYFKNIGDARNESDASDSLAIIYSRSGETEKALSLFERALKISRDIGDPRGVLTSLTNIGFAYQDADQWQRSKAIFDEALKLSRDVKDTKAEARALNGLGGIARRAKDFKEAQKCYLAALPALKEAGDKRAIANVYGNLANCEADMGRPLGKRKYCEQSLEIFKSLNDNHGVSNMHIGIGDTYTHGNDLEKAVQHYKLGARHANLAGNRQYEAAALYALAKIERDLGRKKDALNNYRKAVEILEALRADFGGLSEAQSGFLSGKVHFYYAYLDALVDSGNANEGFALAQKTKARSLLDLLAAGRVDIGAELTSEEKAKEAELREQADYLNQQMVREGIINEVGAKKRFAALKEQLSKVEQELTAYTEALLTRYPRLAERRQAKTATSAEVSASICADTAVLEYVTASASRVLLFVTTRAGTKVIVVPVKYDDLAKQAAAFRVACSDPRRSDWKSLGASLHKTLVSPASKMIAGKSRLIVCPDGALWDVPFQALIPSKGKFVADTFDVTYSYSATGLLASMRGKRTSAVNSILVFANPNFGTTKRFGDLDKVAGQRPFDTPSRPFDTPSRPFDQPSRPIDIPSRPIDLPSRPIDLPSRPMDSPSRPMDLPSRAFDSVSRGGAIASLPGTQREADALARDYGSADVFTRNDAQESIAKRIAGKYRYLHFATHGFVNDAAPMLSSIVLAQPPPGTKDDGFLTARELLSLNLSGTEMVTLSACNTARGMTRSGEGIIGLTWALGVAGVRTQVVSQWAVDDASTATLMERFYSGLSKGSSKSRALQGASRLLRNDGKHGHPYYWAPFVLLGDWR